MPLHFLKDHQPGRKVTLGVYFRRAFDVPEPLDLYAILKSDDGEYKTSTVNDATSAVFDDLFLISIPDSDKSVLKFKVADDKRFRKDSTAGKATLQVSEVLKEPEAYRQGKILELVDEAGQLAGRLEVQIFTEAEVPAGPLSVLCCTWNVGNAPPPEDLKEWLRGVDTGDHHVVAVAAQECQYDNKDGKKPHTAEGAAPGAKPSPVESDMDGVHSTVDSTPATGTSSGPSTPPRSEPAETAGKPNKPIFAHLQHRLKGTKFDWVRHIAKAVGNQYWLLEAANMGQIRLLVFVRVDIVAAVAKDFTKDDEEATGIAGVVSNKGGVSVALRIFNTDLCFISAHLAAHQDKTKDRNEDYREIIKGIDVDRYKSDPATSPHYTFFMGDLNYRLDWGEQAKTFAESPALGDWQSLVKQIESGDYAPLLPLDQLKKEMDAKRVLVGFKEGPITFAPTFKVVKKHPPGAKGTDYYTTKRSPAWCDRVLVRSGLPHLQATIGHYYSAPSIVTSDHKPVGCVVQITPALHTLGASHPSSAASGDALQQYKLVLTGLVSEQEWEDLGLEYDSVALTVHGPAVSGKHEVALLRPKPKGKGALLKAGHKVEALLRAGPLQDMLDERVLLKVEGLDTMQGIERTLGTALLPLHDAAKAAQQGSPADATPFTLTLLKNGMFAGVVSGKLQLVYAGEPTAAEKKTGLAAHLGSLFKKK